MREAEGVRRRDPSLKDGPARTLEEKLSAREPRKLHGNADASSEWERKNRLEYVWEP